MAVVEKPTQTLDQATDAARRTLQILEGLFDADARQRVGVLLWDGTRWPDDAPRPATLVLNHPGALRAMFLPGTELALGEAYIYNDFDILGDIEAVFSLADALAAATSGWRKKLLAARDLLRLPPGPDRQHGRRGPARLAGKRHSIQRDRQAVTYHYDVSNDFYALWLDRRMVYSCAYFQTADDDLDTAQEQKLEYICRKLRLRPGQRLLERLVGMRAQRLLVAVFPIVLVERQDPAQGGADDLHDGGGALDQVMVELVVKDLEEQATQQGCPIEGVQAPPKALPESVAIGEQLVHEDVDAPLLEGRSMEEAVEGQRVSGHPGDVDLDDVAQRVAVLLPYPFLCPGQPLALCMALAELVGGSSDLVLVHPVGALAGDPHTQPALHREPIPPGEVGWSVSPGLPCQAQLLKPADTGGYVGGYGPKAADGTKEGIGLKRSGCGAPVGWRRHRGSLSTENG
mgnify:CR=1 FL=1